MTEKNKDNNDYILLYHRNKQNKTIKDFMEREYIYSIEPSELFDFNRDFIFQQMTEEDKNIEKERIGKYPTSSADLSVDSILPCPCKLKINPNNITAQIAISQTNLQVDSDFYAFADEKIQSIYQDSGYVVDNSTKQAPDCRVIGWFKSMYAFGMTNNGKKTRKEDAEFIDLSKHIISLTTSVTANGGNFTMRLPIICSEAYMSTIGLSNDDYKEDAVGFIEKKQYSYDDGKQFFARTSSTDIYGNYYNTLISSNDLMLISFEKLEMETIRSLHGDERIDLKTELSKGVYDMIGLVDNVRTVYDSSGNGYVEVTGRDFMKLLIDDGSFFFQLSTSSDPSSVFINDQSYGKQGDIREADILNNTYSNPINRLRRLSGEIDIFANRYNMDIGYILKGVISQLANVEIVPDYVFESWGADRTKFVDLQPKESEDGDN